MLAYAILFAVCHQGNAVDKAGELYLFHLARVAGQVKGDAKTVAWLHDVVEDTDCTLGDLKKDFPQNVVEAVDAITKRDGEPYAAYLTRVESNDLALEVKLADIADNTDPERLAKLDSKTQQRLTKKI